MLFSSMIAGGFCENRNEFIYLLLLYFSMFFFFFFFFFCLFVFVFFLFIYLFIYFFILLYDVYNPNWVVCTSNLYLSVLSILGKTQGKMKKQILRVHNYSCIKFSICS